MGLKNEKNNETLLMRAKARAQTAKGGTASNPKMQQGLTADRKKTGIVRAGDR